MCPDILNHAPRNILLHLSSRGLGTMLVLLTAHPLRWPTALAHGRSSINIWSMKKGDGISQGTCVHNPWTQTAVW